MAKKTLKQQAEAMLQKDVRIGKSKSTVKNIGKTNYKQFTSIRSYTETVNTISRIADSLGVDRLKKIDKEMALNYLHQRREQKRSHDRVLNAATKSKLVSQKTLDADRKALSILLRQPLERVHTQVNNQLSSRAYTNDQVNAIASAQSERNSLATRIAHDAGLRASELFTLQKKDERNVVSDRQWHPARFAGENGERYIVKGKGGLVREVVISQSLSKELEARRLKVPETIKDRGVKYTQHYDIGGGNSFSKSVSATSERVLGYSHGAHGLRHQYSQARMLKLQTMGYSERVAKTIVSQEVGHFRASIINVYLR